MVDSRGVEKVISVLIRDITLDADRYRSNQHKFQISLVHADRQDGIVSQPQIPRRLDNGTDTITFNESLKRSIHFQLSQEGKVLDDPLTYLLIEKTNSYSTDPFGKCVIPFENFIASSNSNIQNLSLPINSCDESSRVLGIVNVEITVTSPEIVQSSKSMSNYISNLFHIRRNSRRLSHGNVAEAAANNGTETTELDSGKGSGWSPRSIISRRRNSFDGTGDAVRRRSVSNANIPPTARTSAPPNLTAAKKELDELKERLKNERENAQAAGVKANAELESAKREMQDLALEYRNMEERLVNQGNDLRSRIREQQQQTETYLQEVAQLKEECDHLKGEIEKLLRRPQFLWERDQDHRCCMNSSCEARFTLTLRRHHCRLCGGIYCYRCSGNQVTVPLSAQAHPMAKEGGPLRACDKCTHRVADLQAAGRS